jgi:hypothetical protein
MTPPRSRIKPRTVALLIAAPLLLVLLAVVGLALLIPQYFAAPKVDVQANAARYDEVIRLIDSGQWQSGTIDAKTPLPDELRDLSAGEGGEIIVHHSGDDLTVYFYPQGQWVYMYTQSSPPPAIDGCSQPEPQRPHWFLLQCFSRSP